MKRREVLMLGTAAGWLGGCAIAGHVGDGETASYSLFNPSYEHSFEKATLRSVEPSALLNERLLAPALPPGAPGWSGGGPLFTADTGHRVPHRVKVSWRIPPRAEQKRYEGDLVGPYEIELRSRIPSEALDAAKQPGAILETAVSVGVVPIQVRWQLVRPNEQGRLRTVRKSGDW